MSDVLGLGRSIRFVRLFRREPIEPAPFYRYLAADTIVAIEAHHRLDGAVVVDIGGGPGYVADAVRAAGATCLVAEYDFDELFLHGRVPTDAMQGDAMRLGIRSSSIDVCHSSNVAEHVPDPRAMIDEMVRVVRPGGLVYLSFTNWLSPWGGHETSPWHYLGGERAAQRWERRTGRPAKNRFGTSLYRLDIADVLRWVRGRSDVVVLDAVPRYLPPWTRPVLKVPGLREIVTWNLVLILRKT